MNIDAKYKKTRGEGSNKKDEERKKQLIHLTEHDGRQRLDWMRSI